MVTLRGAFIWETWGSRSSGVRDNRLCPDPSSRPESHSRCLLENVAKIKKQPTWRWLVSPPFTRPWLTERWLPFQLALSRMLLLHSFIIFDAHKHFRTQVNLCAEVEHSCVNRLPHRFKCAPCSGPREAHALIFSSCFLNKGQRSAFPAPVLFHSSRGWGS